MRLRVAYIHYQYRAILSRPPGCSQLLTVKKSVMNPNASVAEIMTIMPQTVKPSTSASEIGRLFELNSFHHLPVTDNGALVGIISKQDFLRIQHTLSFNWKNSREFDSDFEDFLARDIMTEAPMHLNPDDTIGLAADIFLANKFHALPILDDKVLVGIVTAHDIIAYAFKSPVEGMAE